MTKNSAKIVYLFKDSIDLSFIKIKKEDFVVIKPNLIRQARHVTDDCWECVITNEPIIRAVCEYVCSCLGENGRLVICDAPQTDSSFETIKTLLNLEKIVEDCKQKYNVQVEIYDLRNEEWKTVNEIVEQRKSLKGDPNGTVAFNLGEKSLFYGHSGEGKYYGADYDSSIVNLHHNGKTQEYLVAKTPILADVFINLPKLKCHKKTGVTLSVKNVVGINADKNWLPHHVDGSPKNGGDQYPNVTLFRTIEHFSVKAARFVALRLPFVGPKIAQRLRTVGKSAFGSSEKTIRSGNWHGNNTTWRMSIDLNRCLLYGRPDGSFDTNNPKRYYSIIDGMIGMEGMGPSRGDPVKSGIYIGGADPVLVDTVAARFMGFDWKKIPIIREAYKLKELPITHFLPDDIVIKSNVQKWNGKFTDIASKEKFMQFKAPLGWSGYIEAD